jgi:hypothetical protein
MVGAMSGHNAEYIMKKMPYARALQFRTAWYQSKGIKLKGDIRQPTLDDII